MKADSPPESAWSVLERKPRHEVKTEPRARPRNIKDDIVMERELYDLHLPREDVAEFDCQPGACKQGRHPLPIGKPLPAALIRKLAKARLAEIAAYEKKKAVRPARKASKRGR